MKRLLRILGSLILVGILLVAFSLVYSTAKGYMTWFFRVNGQVTVDGHKTAGYMHANTERTILLLTRTDGLRKETYLVPLGEGRTISDCADWHPVRFLPIAIGDINPPCFLTDPKQIADAPISATLKFQPRSVEFSTVSGKRVRAEW
ncbi:MAG: hypothetical protein ACLQBK_18440 [Candidatus Sulfotelmatobacter sp.]